MAAAGIVKVAKTLLCSGPGKKNFFDFWVFVFIIAPESGW